MQKEIANNLELLGQGSAFEEELCSMLEQLPMFRELTRQEIEQLSHFVQAFEATKDKILFNEGDKGGFMCFVAQGRVEILKESELRERKSITTVRPGQTVGEMSLLDEMPYSATTRVVEDAKVVMLTRRNFDKLTEEFPALGVKLIKKIARLVSLRLRQTTGILADYI